MKCNLHAWIFNELRWRKAIAGHEGKSVVHGLWFEILEFSRAGPFLFLSLAPRSELQDKCWGVGLGVLFRLKWVERSSLPVSEGEHFCNPPCTIYIRTIIKVNFRTFLSAKKWYGSTHLNSQQTQRIKQEDDKFEPCLNILVRPCLKKMRSTGDVALCKNPPVSL